MNVTFLDVPSDYWALQFIDRLYSAGITGGCSVTLLKYCPDSTVTRAQMAVFLLKGMHGSSYTPPAISGNTGFADVAVDHWAAAWIKQLAAEGITSGCGAGNYCPDSTVTRAQMAIFLLKAKNGSSYAPPAVGGSTGFSDMAVNYWAAPFIKQLVADGITAGCGGGNYCPDSSVTRAQMAVFLVKTFNLP
ncbi:MAG: S-layer homology domain-containing protein [Anaerolineales bacterium]|uniref:S-layer homology domain-containing protein n=1 Tax=Candidatus Villigracilis proximus TaxID=3140683 RepID=UPI003134A092|nr:S-layer homology domain-containing protein [Anaerolineales bacterium]